MKISISGIRGIYGTDFDLKDIARYTKLFASSLITGKSCVIGRDTRTSSSLLSDIVSASLMEYGIDVYDLGIAPTPVVFRESRKYGAGIVITASHNPLNWNGLKFILKGRGLFESELEKMLNSSKNSNSVAANSLGKKFSINSTYMDEVIQLVTKSDNNIERKIGLDLGGGSACGYAYNLFKELGFKVISINDIYGVSSRSPDPTADTLNELRTLVNVNQLDFGFAFDPDGDRLVTVDSHGNKLSSDATLLLCVAKSIELGMRKFVVSLDTSLAIEKLVKSFSGSLSYSKIGEANVVKLMLDTGAEAGGEGSSAGFIMPKFNMCRDGFLASTIIASVSSELLENCFELSNKHEQIRDKLPLDTSLHKTIIEKITYELKGEATEVITSDGIKIIFDENSWALIRPSNTEHAIRISVETQPGSSQKLFSKIHQKVHDLYDKIK